ncbi:RIB43A-like with coiled-coils protein 2 isoform X1 [Xyrichtys novacula]|uniref:RIB43A-like with coiled-coils protein 2 isoform X1 n=1 Tax=Xyrichtys novacula TaxID=13765 RepID=A0AAV1F847_XYRNO|nr:RIB43A-like with coiled-coils protein 2 isoform X1 [Xyrichtys novacula]
MFNFETLTDRIARASLQRRQNNEAERKERIFNDKVRTIGLDLEVLESQIKEKKKLEEAAKEEQNAYDAEMLHSSKVASLLHNRQVKEKRAMEKDIVNYRHQFQQPCSKREFDLNNPDKRKTELSEVQAMLPGLAGEDPDSESRRQRQKEQLRGWLMQQQSERESERHQQQLEELRCYQNRIEMENRALELESLNTERRKAAAVATKEFNLSMVAEKERRQVTHQTGEGTSPVESMVGVPGFYPDSEHKVPAESPQQVIQFQKNQVEEKKKIERQKKQEEELLDRVRLDSARAAMLLERQQARLNKQLRQHLDNSNVQLAEIQKQREPDIKRGGVDNSFFSQFNTCSR